MNLFTWEGHPGKYVGDDKKINSYIDERAMDTVLIEMDVLIY